MQLKLKLILYGGGYKWLQNWMDSSWAESFITEHLSLHLLSS